MATSDEELRLRHLADVQATVSRLAQNSFTIRGWSVTLVSVVFAVIGARDAGARMAWLPLLPAVVFWWLDAYYLRLERLYRRLYADIAAGLSEEPTVRPFDMDIGRYRAAVPGMLATLVAPSVVTLPAVLAGVILGYLAITG